MTADLVLRPSWRFLARHPAHVFAFGFGVGLAPVAPGTALGLSLQPLNAEIIRALNLPAETRGVVITSIDPGSDAAEKGIRRGDVILSVNRQPVTAPAQVLSAVDTARRAGRSSVLLLVKRGQAPEAFVGVDISAR